MYGKRKWDRYFEEGGILSKVVAAFAIGGSLPILIAVNIDFKYKGLFLFASVCFILGVTVIFSGIRYFAGIGAITESATGKILKVLQIIFSCSLIAGLYPILMTQNYNLYYTYWIIAISFAGILLISDISTYIEKRYEYNFRKNPIKFLIIFSNIFVLIFMGILVYNMYKPKKIITITELKRPIEISIYLESANKRKSSDAEYLIKSLNEMHKHEVKIKDGKVIDNLYKEIENKTLENIRNIESINYERMASDQKNYVYILSEFIDGSVAYGGKNAINGYVNSMRLYQNGTLVILQYNGGFEEYPLRISQDVTRQIFEIAK